MMLEFFDEHHINKYKKLYVYGAGMYFEIKYQNKKIIVY